VVERVIPVNHEIPQGHPFDSGRDQSFFYAVYIIMAFSGCCVHGYIYTYTQLSITLIRCVSNRMQCKYMKYRNSVVTYAMNL
jgi:hypothetical protein